MIKLTSASLKVFLALDPCDMRKSFNGLHNLASDPLQTAPARDATFVFTNKRRNRIKLKPKPSKSRDLPRPNRLTESATG